MATALEGMPFIEEAIREVANLCGGLPLALIVVWSWLCQATR